MSSLLRDGWRPDAIGHDQTYSEKNHEAFGMLGIHLHPVRTSHIEADSCPARLDLEGVLYKLEGDLEFLK
jgi:hypothetical protein